MTDHVENGNGASSLSKNKSSLDSSAPAPATLHFKRTFTNLLQKRDVSSKDGEDLLPASRQIFDMNSFVGRFKYFWHLTSSATLMASIESIRRAQEFEDPFARENVKLTKEEVGNAWDFARTYFRVPLNEHCTVNEEKPTLAELSKKYPSVSLAHRWRCERLIAATTHPESGEYVYPPFRRSAFVAANIPIYCGMLLSPQTRGFILFWQWFNQSYNCGMNYFNRSGDRPTPTRELLTSYVLAASASCAAGLSAKSLMNHITTTNPILRAAALGFVPFCGSASAGCLNVALTRREEYFEGVVIRKGPQGRDEVVGRSRIAGAHALRDTFCSRILLIAFGMILPPVCMSLLDGVGLFDKNAFGRWGAQWRPRLRTPVYIGIVGVSLRLALPLSLAPWHWFCPIKLGSLERELWEYGGADTDRVVYYNRGM